MNKTQARWKLYNKLNKHYLIFQRKGGYTLDKLIGFVETIYWCPTDLSFVDSTTYTGMKFIFEQIDYAVKKQKEIDAKINAKIAAL